MQDNDTQETVTHPAEAPGARAGWLSTGRGKAIALVTGAALLAGGAFGVQAVAESKAYRHFASFEGGWHHRDHKPFAEMTDEEIQAKVTRAVRHLGIEIDATPEQETRLVEIATGAATELRPLRQQMRMTGQELKTLLTAETVDRAALETLRAERLAEADRISKTLVDAVADLAEVLTPEQRETVAELIRERHERRGEGHHWRHGEGGHGWRRGG